MTVISFRPSTFAKGGFLDDVDVDIVRARFVTFDYDGKADKPTLALCVTYKDSAGDEHTQYYSAGDLQFFVPSEDPKNEDLNGITIAQVGSKAALSASSNFAIFANSLANAGFPEDELDKGDIRVIEGLNVHVNQVPAPKRSNLPQKAREDGREKTILVVTKINEAAAPTPAKGAATSKGAATKAAASTAKPASAPAAADDSLADELSSELVGLFAAKEVESMKKSQIAQGLFSSIEKTNPNRNKLVAMAGRDEVLKALDGFTYDGSVLKMG
jgi:hypothetical protein